MTNTLNTIKNAPGIIVAAAAQMLADEMHFCKSIAKVPASEFDGKNGYKSGDTVYISKPSRYIPQTTFDITSTAQAETEEKVGITANIISTVGLGNTSLEFAYELEMQGFMERVLKPAVSAIAQNVEQRMIEKASDATYNCVGTAGSTTFAPDDILSAREKMSKYLAPKDDNRFFLHDSTAGRKAVGERKGLFQSSSNIAEQYKKGYVGTADGYNWMESELLNVHTLGNDVTGAAIDDTVATGATTIHIDGITTGTGTVTAGSVFTIAGVYAVHPITKQAYPFLQQFVVVTGGTASGTSDIDLVISPPIYGPTSLSLQNVDALPANDAAIVFVGSASTAYTQNLAYHKNAFRMVSLPLIMPTKAEFAMQKTVDGITVAVIRDFDVKTRDMITRLDFLGGFCADRPEWACRITS